MKSIPTIFVWDKISHTVIDKPLRMVDWVFTGKGTPTRKWDGIAILVDHGKVFRRYEWRQGSPMPLNFIRTQDPDPRRTHAPIPGWVPVSETFLTDPKGIDEKILKEAFQARLNDLTQAEWAKIEKEEHKNKGVNLYVSSKNKYKMVTTLPDGTYELCGPKIRNNHDHLQAHVLYKHGEHTLKNVPRTYEGLKKFFATFDGEGVVWHYQLTPGVTMMAKIKGRDFGITRPNQKPEENTVAEGEASSGA